MNNFWCHDVPKNINKAFQQNDPDQDSLFRFSAKNMSLNTYQPINYQPCISNQNWKTLNNLSTASNYITSYNKRKILNEDDDLLFCQPPNKQNATEAKVMEKFNMLKLDETEDLNENIIKHNFNDEIDFEFENNFELLENDFEDKKIEIAESVQDFWDCNDVMQKMFQNEKDKNSKALVLWKPRISYLNIDKHEKNKTKIIEKNDDYTVSEEIECDQDEENENNSVKIIEIEDTMSTEEMEI